MKHMNSQEEKPVDLIEIIDTLCEVVERLAEITKKQTAMIEQAELRGAVFSDDLKEEKVEIERKARRIQRSD